MSVRKRWQRTHHVNMPKQIRPAGQAQILTSGRSRVAEIGRRYGGLTLHKFGIITEGSSCLYLLKSRLVQVLARPA